MTDWRGIESAIRDAARPDFVVAHAAPMGSGDINTAYRLQGNDGTHFFVKLNDAKPLPMFAAETDGLQSIAQTQTIRVPQPVTCGSTGGQSYLVLEYLEFGSHNNARLLGEQLAALHRFTADSFGFAHDNFIGSTPQPNAWANAWIDFLRERRLGFQLQLAHDNGYRGRLQALGTELLDKLPLFFDGYAPQPSLLHGDLWGGNHAYLADGTPVIFDPAVYYGDRECDLAMSELFGGYPPEFYTAYRSAWPMDTGYETRKRLYNLYHLLNHANLFGRGYAVQAEQTIRDLLARI